jgi:hypothetical protein
MACCHITVEERRGEERRGISTFTVACIETITAKCKINYCFSLSS